MYTSHDVLEMMDSLPVGERLLVVEETLRKIRISEVVEMPIDKEGTSASMKIIAKPYKHPILELAGIWSDAEAEEIKAIIEEGNTIDYDEW